MQCDEHRPSPKQDKLSEQASRLPSYKGRPAPAIRADAVVLIDNAQIFEGTRSAVRIWHRIYHPLFVFAGLLATIVFSADEGLAHVVSALEYLVVFFAVGLGLTLLLRTPALAQSLSVRSGWLDLSSEDWALSVLLIAFGAAAVASSGHWVLPIGVALLTFAAWRIFSTLAAIASWSRPAGRDRRAQALSQICSVLHQLEYHSKVTDNLLRQLIYSGLLAEDAMLQKSREALSDGLDVVGQLARKNARDMRDRFAGMSSQLLAGEISKRDLYRECRVAASAVVCGDWTFSPQGDRLELNYRNRKPVGSLLLSFLPLVVFLAQEISGLHVLNPQTLLGFGVFSALWGLVRLFAGPRMDLELAAQSGVASIQGLFK